MHARVPTFLVAIAILAPALAPFATAAPARDAARVATTGIALPRVVGDAAAVAIGGVVYVLGGCGDGCSDTIVRIDAATGVATTMAAKLPFAKPTRAAAALGGVLYLFVPGERVIRFDPAADAVIELDTVLPAGEPRPTAAIDNGNVVVFANDHARVPPASLIHRFNPVTETLTRTVVTRPSSYSCNSTNTCPAEGSYPFDGATAVSDGSRIFLVCGDQCRQKFSPGHVFVPALKRECWRTGDVFLHARPDPVLVATIAPRAGAMAFYDGSDVIVAGGDGAGGALDDVLRYRHATRTMTTLPARLPSPRGFGAAAWTGAGALLVGGTTTLARHEVLAFDWASSAPVSLSASGAPSGVRLSWSPPTEPGSRPIDRYEAERVHASATTALGGPGV